MNFKKLICQMISCFSYWPVILMGAIAGMVIQGLIQEDSKVVFWAAVLIGTSTPTAWFLWNFPKRRQKTLQFLNKIFVPSIPSAAIVICYWLAIFFSTILLLVTSITGFLIGIIAAILLSILFQDRILLRLKPNKLLAI